MAFVANSLFMIFGSSDDFVGLDVKSPEDLKTRIKEAIDAVPKKSKDKKPISTIEEQDQKILQSLADDGDPVASALLGASIWRGLVETDSEDIAYASINDSDQLLGKAELVLLPHVSTDLFSERRARQALPFLDFAVQAGVKASFVDIYEVHRSLAKLYERLNQDAKGLGA
jgi:hypothetical protein